MAINFKPFDELFAPAYQLTYISKDGHITVGPNTYNVFYTYTMVERQQIFQVCEKYLPWEYTEKQEQWELAQYMQQFVIKSPPPFPHEEYPLSKDIVPDGFFINTLNIIDKNHYLLHLNAVIKDADDAKNEEERERIIAGAQDIIDNKILIFVKQPCHVHDWIEIPESRVTLNG